MFGNGPSRPWPWQGNSIKRERRKRTMRGVCKTVCKKHAKAVMSSAEIGLNSPVFICSSASPTERRSAEFLPQELRRRSPSELWRNSAVALAKASNPSGPAVSSRRSGPHPAQYRHRVLRLFATERNGSSRAVHEAYARGAVVICPPLDEYETIAGAKTVTTPAAPTFSAHALDETTPASHREKPITTLGFA